RAGRRGDADARLRTWHLPLPAEVPPPRVATEALDAAAATRGRLAASTFATLAVRQPRRERRPSTRAKEQRMDLERVTYSTTDEGRIAVVGLNRPRYRNALSLQTMRELDQAFAEAVADEAVR